MPLLDNPQENDPTDAYRTRADRTDPYPPGNESTETYPTENDPTERLRADSHGGSDPTGLGHDPEIPGYRVLHPIGRGGFSVVYKARQVATDRDVALKVVTVSLDEDVHRRFLREVALIDKLAGHPHVVDAVDAGHTPSGYSYLAMELYEGGTLADRLREDGPIPAYELAQIGARMANALAAAHARGIVHRDVKPSNILVSEFGEPALTDFGVACLLDDQVSKTVLSTFTLRHAAPEVINGSNPSASSDIYALGSTLYELLAGRPAFGGQDIEIVALIMQIVAKQPPPIHCPELPALVEVILRAMSKRPEDRFASAAEMESELLSALGNVRDASPTQAPASTHPDTSSVEVMIGGRASENAPAADRAGPTSPAPTSPAPTSLAPASPAPTSPAPTSPAPTSPAPTSPAPTSPAPPGRPSHQPSGRTPSRTPVPAQRGRRRTPKLVILAAIAVLAAVATTGATAWQNSANEPTPGSGAAAGNETVDEPPPALPSADPSKPSTKPSASKSTGASAGPSEEDSAPATEPSGSPTESPDPEPTDVPSQEPPDGATSVCAPGCAAQAYFVSFGEHLFVCDNDANDGLTTAAVFATSDDGVDRVARNSLNPGQCADHNLSVSEGGEVAFRACVSDDTGRLFRCSDVVSSVA